MDKFKKQVLNGIGILMLAGSFSDAHADQIYVWQEAEKPAKSNFEFKTMAKKGIVSGEYLIHSIGMKEKVPKDGFLLEYVLNVSREGEYNLWLRYGFDHVAAPIEYRLNNGVWHEYLPMQQNSLNLVGVSAWNELSWALIGKKKLRAGKHKLKLRYNKKGDDGRLLIGLDCIALVKGDWIPDGIIKPGESYNDPVDKEAAKKMFSLSESLNYEKRTEMLLNGLWEVARWDDTNMNANTFEPIRKLPKDLEQLKWRGVKVPGDVVAQRPEMNLGHRFFYKTKIQIPKSYKGSSFHLHFHGASYIISVFVNGQYIDFHRSALVPGDIDVTSAIKPGQENALIIGVKDVWYAYAPSRQKRQNKKMISRVLGCNNGRNIPRSVFSTATQKSWLAPVIITEKGEGDATLAGLINPVRLVVTGPVYTDDVYVRTSVQNKEITAEVSIKNPGKIPQSVFLSCEVVNDKNGKIEKTFDPVALNLPAGQQKTIQFKDKWENPKLWWPAESIDDKPDCYRLRVKISLDDKLIDLKEQLFGFREITYEGRNLLLNGIRWHFWNWHINRAVEGDVAWLKKYFAGNNRFHRICFDEDKRWEYREKALEFFDRNGIPGRLSTCIEGMMISYNMESPVFWKNCEEHIRQVVKAYRNSPSIIMWSQANEFLLVCGRLGYGGIYGELEENTLKYMIKPQEELDPTRRGFCDGGGDLGGLIQMNNQHYSLPKGQGFPTLAYDYLKRSGPVKSKRHYLAENLYIWDGKMPLILGEVMYYGGNIENSVWIGGPNCYRGQQFADAAYAKFVRINSEGARWQDVTGICPWVSDLPANAERSWEPQAVLIREHNSLFRPGKEIVRTYKVFNDGRKSESLTFKWQVIINNKTIDSGEKTYAIPAGRWKEDTFKMKFPAVNKRTNGELKLELYAGNKKVFNDERIFSVLPEEKEIAGLNKDKLSVYDPLGNVIKWLKKKKIPFTKIKSLQNIPGTSSILLVANNAIPAPAGLLEEIKLAAEKNMGTTVFYAKQKIINKLINNPRPESKAIADFVKKGNTAIVLEQELPLIGDELPVSGFSTMPKKHKEQHGMMEHRNETGSSGAIAFAVTPAHRVLQDLQSSDFFTWCGDSEDCFKSSVITPESGVLCLIQAGEGLDLTPMMEVPVGKGNYLLSQMLIGEKIGVEPAADRLLFNALSWAANIQVKAAKKTQVLGSDSFKTFLEDTKIDFMPAKNIMTALSGGADILIVEADNSLMKALVKDKKQVEEFCKNGGWLMLNGVKPEDIGSLNQLVGFNHRMRDFNSERVTLENFNDKMVIGITDRDFKQNSTDFVAKWAHTYKVSATVFSDVIDGDNIAGFSKLGDDYHKNLINGLNNDDSWKYICYFQTADSQYKEGDGNRLKDRVSFTFDRKEMIKSIRVWPNESYRFIKDIELIFDGDTANALQFSLKPRKGWQDLSFKPKAAKEITLIIKNTQNNPFSDNDKDITGIDMIQVIRELPADFKDKVVFYSNPAGLAKYPIGKGGIFLNQVDYRHDDGVKSDGRKSINHGNRQKKISIFANLLRNMGASYK